MKVNKLVLCVIVITQFNNPVFASDSNFNFTAFESASQSGIDHANCNSALITSGCETLSAGPSPILGGGLGSFVIATLAFVLKRKNKK